MTPRPSAREEALKAGLVLFALYHLGLAAFMAIAPHAFFRAIGPFGALNTHYIRDTATFEAALGFGFAVALRVRSWRTPVLAVTTVQFALHSVNHLIDAHSAHPQWTGWFDFAALLVSTLLLAWLTRVSSASSPAVSEPANGTQTPLASTPIEKIKP